MEIKSKQGIVGFLSGLEVLEATRSSAIAESKQHIAEIMPVIKELSGAAANVPGLLAEVKTEEKCADELLGKIDEHSKMMDPSVFAGQRTLLNSIPDKIDTVTKLIEATRAMRKSKVERPEIWKVRSLDTAYHAWLRSSVDGITNSEARFKRYP